MAHGETLRRRDRRPGGQRDYDLAGRLRHAKREPARAGKTAHGDAKVLTIMDDVEMVRVGPAQKGEGHGASLASRSPALQSRPARRACFQEAWHLTPPAGGRAAIPPAPAPSHE